MSDENPWISTFLFKNVGGALKGNANDMKCYFAMANSDGMDMG